MRSTANYILNNLDKKLEISPFDQKVLNSVLNISFIKKLILFWFKENDIDFKIIEEMFDYFNNLKERKIEKDEIKYIIENYSYKYNSDFKIKFPKFSAMDLVYLFIDINYINDEKDEKKSNFSFINGILLRDIDIGPTGLKKLSSINPRPIDNFIQCLNEISFNIFEELRFDMHEYANALPALKNIYKGLKDEKDIEKMKIKNLIQNLMKLFDEEKVIKILRKDYTFNVEDINILNFIENYQYLENVSICKNYPSLIYFLTENKIDRTEFFKVTNNKDNNNIPFWLFCLRYYSSLNCIISKENNYFSNLIDEYIKKKLSNELKKVRRKNLGIYWLNLVCSNKISKFYNPFYEKIKNFLYRISKDEYFIHINKESYINKQIDIIFNKLIEVIIDKIFDNSLNNYCKDKNNNDITNFLKNPNKYLYEKISINIANELMENIDNKKDVINRIIDNIKKIENFKENELKTNIENELEIKNNDYKEIKEINNREKNDRLFKSFIKDLDKYKILFQELIGINKISSGFQNKIKESIELYDNLTKYFQKTIRKGEKLELLKINFSINIETNINILVKNKNDDETLLYEIEGYYGEFYIFNEPLEDIIFINKKNNKTLKEINIMQSKVLLHSLILIEDENKLDSNIDNNFNSITLKFGSGSSLNEFYKYFSLYKNKLKELKNILALLLEKKDVILNCNFNNKSYKKDINSFISLCFIKFSDDSKCESINKDLLEIKTNLKQILIDYNLISNHFSKLYETLEINTKFKNKLLEKNYKLNEISVKKPIKDLVDFSKLNYDSCLSVPIINVDPQTYENFCSIKEVKSSIGPIYPNLFSESYKINILNFQDKEYNIYNNDDYIYHKNDSEEDKKGKDEEKLISKKDEKISNEEQKEYEEEINKEIKGKKKKGKSYKELVINITSELKDEPEDKKPEEEKQEKEEKKEEKSNEEKKNENKKPIEELQDKKNEEEQKEIAKINKKTKKDKKAKKDIKKEDEQEKIEQFGNISLMYLYEQLINKDKEINDLKEIISRYPFELSKNEKIISIIFTCYDEELLCSMICKNTEQFSKIERLFYDKYPEYKECYNFYNNYGNIIDRIKTLKENKIEDNSIIILKKIIK